MKTVGQMLKETRVKKNLSLGDVERSTKIRIPFLHAIELDEFHKLPSPVYAKGFIRNYAEYLGLSSERMMAFYRRQSQESSKSSIVPKGIAQPLNPPSFQLTPGKFLGFIIGILLVAFLLYLGSQYRKLYTPPFLTITSPQDNANVNEKRIVVEGKADPDATVLINGVSTVVRDDGRFYDQVTLEVGNNKITVVATSRYGKTTQSELQVMLSE